MTASPLVWLVQSLHFILSIVMKFFNRVVGTIKAERFIDSEGSLYAEFGLFSVDPSFQSNGIGRRLLSAAEGATSDLLPEFRTPL